MLSLFGALLGFGSSFLPKVMDYFQDKQDKKHELAVMDKQLEVQKATAQIKLQMVETEADIREIEALHNEQAATVKMASKFIASLSASIRPVITYLFVIEYLVITWGIAWLLIDSEGVTIETLRQILDNEFMALLATMLTFWFGNRTYGNRKT